MGRREQDGHGEGGAKRGGRGGGEDVWRDFIIVVAGYGGEVGVNLVGAGGGDRGWGFNVSDVCTFGTCCACPIAKTCRIGGNGEGASESMGTEPEWGKEMDQE